MAIVHFPYRWLPRTLFPNLSYGWRYLWNGVRNIFRFLPVVWHDQDGDFAPLLRLMEYKIRRMERVHGGHVGDEEQRRDMRVAAELCKRLAEDHVYTSCTEDWYDGPCYFEGLRHRRYIRMRRDEAKLFGKILGTKMLRWWC